MSQATSSNEPQPRPDEDAIAIIPGGNIEVKNPVIFHIGAVITLSPVKNNSTTATRLKIKTPRAP